MTADEKLDKVLEHIGTIDVVLARQEANLSDQLRRTALLEAQIAPLMRHVAMAQGVAKFVGMLGTVTAILGSLVAWLKTRS